MAGLLRDHEWRHTPLGAAENWPQSLKTAVELMLCSPQPVSICWGRGLVTLYNEACIPLLKNRHPEFLGKPYGEVWPDGWTDIKPFLDATLAGNPQQLVGQRIRRQDKQASWFTWSLTPLRGDNGQIAGVYCAAAETTLQIGDEQLRTVLENTRDGVFMQDIHNRKYLYVSPAMAALTGFTANELRNMPEAERRERTHPDDRALIVDEIERLAAGDATEAVTEHRWRVKSGEYRCLSVSGKVVRDPAGKPSAIVGVCRDISEQRQAELALRESEKRYRLLHETQRDGFVMVSMDGRISESNELYQKMLGYTAEELRQITYLDLTPERWHNLEAEIVQTQVLPRGYSDVYEKEYRRKDGTVFPVELRSVLSRDEAGNPDAMWAIVRDVTQRKAAEARVRSLTEELMHVGRVTELSQVSAGIAHELNQPLAAMMNYSAVAKRLIANKDEVSIKGAHSVIAKAGEQAERAAEIIRRMRDFVEKRETHRQAGAINAIIKDAVALGLIGAKADGLETHFEMSPDLPDVLVDRVQIQQVLVNLLRNAVDAMRQSPTRELTLSTSHREGGVEVAVSDTGCGIPEHMWPMLFQPFVTTKPGGMGIGLAISQSIIEAHNGSITAEANPGGGTVFRFTLPPANVQT